MGFYEALYCQLAGAIVYAAEHLLTFKNLIIFYESQSFLNKVWGWGILLEQLAGLLTGLP